MSELVIFGAGDLPRWARVMFEIDPNHTPVAFTVHADYIQADQLEGLPVVPFEGLTESHPSDRFSLFVASGYRRMNALRSEICDQGRRAGYQMPTLVCPGAHVFGALGDNVLVSPGAVVMPHAQVGDGTVLNSGSIVSHDASVGQCCFLAAQATVLGRAVVGDRCFLGAGARIRNSIRVGARSLIGAGVLIMKDTPEDSVYSVPSTQPRDILSTELDEF